MRQFDNPNNISKAIAILRAQKLDETAEIELYQVTRPDETTARYISVDSNLSDTQLEELFNQAETAEEQAYFADYSIDRQQLKAEYQSTIDQLQNIESAQSPTNAQVVAAVKYLAKTIRLMLKLLARLIT